MKSLQAGRVPANNNNCALSKRRVVMSVTAAKTNRQRSHCQRWCLIVLASLWLAATAHASANGVHIELRRRRSVHWNGIELDENGLLQQLAAHERALLFGSATVPEFKFVHLDRRSAQQERRPRQRRSAAQASGPLEAELQLQQTSQLIDDAFIFIRRTANGTQLVEHSPKLLQRFERCFYRSAWAALDLCDDQSVRGVFRQNASNFVVHPLPARFGPAAHVLYQARLDKSNSNSNSQSTPLESVQFEPNAAEFNEPQQHQQQQQQQQQQHSRRKSQSQLRLRYQPRHHHHHYEQPAKQFDAQRHRRHIGGGPRSWGTPHELHIETAIFVDSDLYRHMESNYPRDTESQLVRFVLAMINGVQLLYHHPTLGRRINFVLKRLEIFRKDPPDLQRSRDVDTYLGNFCEWQRGFNPISDANTLHYDHAVILTGYDLYVLDNGKVNSQVVGLAPVAGMCSPNNSCTINEGKHFESVFVVAHEIGHNLGMRHDTQDNSCDSSLHIMSPTLGSGKITWSKCSRTYLEEFISRGQAECLFDRGQIKANLDHNAEGMLPGERFDANQQCMLKYGHNSKRAASQSKSDICHDLHCQRDRLTWTSHPALEGTECGDRMWCRGGTCVLRPSHETALTSLKQLSGLAKPSFEKNAGVAESSKMTQLLQEYETRGNELPREGDSAWSDWGEAGSCDSGCLIGAGNREGSTGLRIFNRSCLNYRQRCRGRDRKFESCIAKQCYGVAKQTIADFATRVCKQARLSDNELSGEGQQLVGSIEDSCKVFCRTKSNATKSRRWTFPDGTSCRAKHYTADDVGYCIAGRCELFSCHTSSNNFFRLGRSYCAYKGARPQRDSAEQQSSYHNNVSYWRNSNRNRNENEVAVRSFQAQDNHMSHSQPYKARYPYSMPNDESQLEHEWQVISGCHSNCMTESKGMQVVRSRHSGEHNIQLCTHKAKPCEQLQTPAEYAEQTCARYSRKVDGLSGHGAQISASVEEPDRSCRVGCQDEFIKYRYYLVNGQKGHFPIGTRCSQLGHRYCVYGKCLEFGHDNLPLQQSHISLALFRSKRQAPQQSRQKRSFLHYAPVNITETITQEFLNSIVNSIIDFERHRAVEAGDNIELSNPIHVSADELSNH